MTEKIQSEYKEMDRKEDKDDKSVAMDLLERERAQSSFQTNLRLPSSTQPPPAVMHTAVPPPSSVPIASGVQKIPLSSLPQTSVPNQALFQTPTVNPLQQVTGVPSQGLLLTPTGTSQTGISSQAIMQTPLQENLQTKMQTQPILPLVASMPCLSGQGIRNPSVVQSTLQTAIGYAGTNIPPPSVVKNVSTEHATSSQSYPSMSHSVPSVPTFGSSATVTSESKKDQARSIVKRRAEKVKSLAKALTASLSNPAADSQFENIAPMVKSIEESVSKLKISSEILHPSASAGTSRQKTVINDHQGDVERFRRSKVMFVLLDSNVFLEMDLEAKLMKIVELASKVKCFQFVIPYSVTAELLAMSTDLNAINPIRSKRATEVINRLKTVYPSRIVYKQSVEEYNDDFDYCRCMGGCDFDRQIVHCGEGYQNREGLRKVLLLTDDKPLRMIGQAHHIRYLLLEEFLEILQILENSNEFLEYQNRLFLGFDYSKFTFGKKKKHHVGTGTSANPSS